MIRLYNTAARAVEEFVPREPGKAGIYVCGMTVYDYCHIGHARAMMAFDVVVRHLRHRGYDVTFVRNHTDVDDKIIHRAREQGRDPLELSAHFVAELDQDLGDLGLLPPTHAPRVTAHMPGVVDMISRLVARGHAYAADNGDVYFSIETFDHYGALSGRRIEELRAGERVAIEEAKRHPGDFALWKAASADELGWESPFGRGRPGWHIECSAMAAHYLGEQFDIHGGGIDLVFPHHENEIAQSECASGHAPFARYWMHNGHLGMSGEKMSKSLGNIVRIRDIVAQVPAEALRFFYLGTHYRSPLPYSTEQLTDALAALDRLYVAKETVEEVLAGGKSAPVDTLGADAREAYRLATSFPAALDAALDDDFNTAAAMGHLFEMVRAINRFGNDRKARGRGAEVLAPAAEAFAAAGRSLGVGALAPAAFFDDVKIKRLRAQGRSLAEVEARISDRAAARSSKDWAFADAIRAELDAQGIVVMDGPQGSTWRVRVE